MTGRHQEQKEVHLPRSVEEAIQAHGARAYPEEACGLLVGPPPAAGKYIVTTAEPLPNVRMESRENRYAIDPLSLAKRERVLDAEGLAILGIYHSHPDHPAVPSEYDREHAWPWFIYIVQKVDHGTPAEYTASTLAEDRSCFHPVAVKLI